jgi:hypothetical protein
MAADPLSLLNDSDLYDTQLILALACGRAHTILRKQHRDRLCFLFTLLNLEAGNRGTPVPSPPYHAPPRPKKL